MEISNTEEEYGLVARIFHWSIAVLIIGLLPVGLGMGAMENSPLKFEIFALHKSFGLLVFFLGLGRIVWRFVSPPPEHLESHEHWETVLASAAHFWLYVCIICMPLSGWLMSSAGEFPIPFFGIQMPALVGKDENLAEFFAEAHEILAYTLLFVLALHAAGALKHHVIDKDETIQRMAYAKAGLGFVGFIVIVLGLSYTLSGSVILREIFEPETPQQEQAQQQAQTESVPPAPFVPAPPADLAALPPHAWAIIPEVSKLTFQAKMYNTPFTGELKNFGGEIIFDPNDLASAKADITVQLKDVVTGDAGRDESIVGAEWFDVAQYPTARFVSKSFEKAEDNNYVAVGELTMRGITMPLVIPFSLNIENSTAQMKAEVVINRLSYGLGGEQYQDESTVAHDVRVTIDLKAAQNL